MELAQGAGVDQELLGLFHDNVASKVPRRTRDGSISNPTPLRDVTQALIDCAKEEYGVDLSRKGITVYGKFDSEIFGGSVKVRPAVQILEDAISGGRLKGGQTVFEATSGNFGIALGLLSKVGVKGIALVSRKIQEGVIDGLRQSGIETVDLDVEICPVPGSQIDVNVLAAKAVAVNVRSQLAELQLDQRPLKEHAKEIEDLLARQDVINLAKLLAHIYGGFSTEQYDNEMNVLAHSRVTGPEIDQGLWEDGRSLADFRVVCTFGTGGTSTGLSRYAREKYGRKAVHVVFPLSGQDVAGIRTKGNATGLRFYRPEEYAGEHEVDFEEAKKLLAYFVKNGYDIGESSALALYATIQIANFGGAKNFVVMVPDGAKKYKIATPVESEAVARAVSLRQAKASPTEYGKVIWTHAMFVPKEAGVEFLASNLEIGEDSMIVADVHDVQRIIATGEVPPALLETVTKAGGKPLFVCMVGNTSMRVAQAFAAKGLSSDSLAGGIMSLATAQGKQPAELLRPQV